jgi:hypothetical protein
MRYLCIPAPQAQPLGDLFAENPNGAFFYQDAVYCCVQTPFVTEQEMSYLCKGIDKHTPAVHLPGSTPVHPVEHIMPEQL